MMFVISPPQAKEQIQKEADATTKPLLLDLLEEINAALKTSDFHGSYFDRRATAKQRLCDKQGWFKCQGAFDRERCDKLHTINPYASRGYRQLFGLWNLDHVSVLFLGLPHLVDLGWCSTLGGFGVVFHTWWIWGGVPHLMDLGWCSTLGGFGVVFHTWWIWGGVPHLVDLGWCSTLDGFGVIFHTWWIWGGVLHLMDLGWCSTLS